MPLPTNINNIINKNVVESVRIECKKGWNPQEITQTIAAFANDIDNFGGGYIIIGATFNKDSDSYEFIDMKKEEIDKVQQEITEYCLKCIKPHYIPMSDVMEYASKRFVVVWAYAGSDRPYTCKEDVFSLKSKDSYYIRKGSTTIKAMGNLEKELISLGQKEPFDDRLNYHASIEDISIELIKEYLTRTNSNLLKVIDTSTKLDICKDLRIIGGPNEAIRPKNIALLMFSHNPEKYIPYSYIDLAIISDPTGRDIVEKRFAGSIVYQYESTMMFIKNNVIKTKIIKEAGQELSNTYANYPLDAIDEIVANAILHKDYSENNPISIRIENTFISITSYPGFDSSIKDKDIKNYVIKSERYRNRRIAEFLKELHIVEAHNTGFPTILESCDENDSDYPILISDENRTFLTVRIPINKRFLDNSFDKRDVEKEIIELLKHGSYNISQISRALGYNQIPGSLKRKLKIMIANGTIELKNKKYSLKQ